MSEQVKRPNPWMMMMMMMMMMANTVFRYYLSHGKIHVKCTFEYSL